MAWSGQCFAKYSFTLQTKKDIWWKAQNSHLYPLPKNLGGALLAPMTKERHKILLLERATLW